MIETVLGHYRIEAELSRGGMGAVYRGRHDMLERPVAIKLLRPELTTSDEMLLRFVNDPGFRPRRLPWRSLYRRPRSCPCP